MATLKKTFSSVAESTAISIARISSEYKDLDVAVIKATNHIETPPKEKHVRTIFAYTSSTRPRADVAYCIHAISKRLGKATSWVVALKSLMVIHRTLREGDPTFREELINYERNKGRFLNITNFRDDSGPASWDYSAWIRTYALYLEEKLECFRVLKYDVESERSSGHSKTRELETPELLEHLPALQSLLQRLMSCQPEGAAVSNHIIQAALGLVLKESFKLYRAINDGIINLVDKFFDMQKADAAKGLEAYKRAGLQAEKLSQFYDMCKSLDLARSFQFPTLEQPPQSFLVTMEDYVNDSKLPDGPAESAKEIKEEEPRPEPPGPPVPEEPPAPEPVAAEPADLLGLDADLAVGNGPNPNQIEAENALALAIVPQGSAPNPAAANAFLSLSSASTSNWELALVSAPSSTNVPAAPNSYPGSDKLAGGLDKLTLDSLYEDALRSPYPSNPYSTGNPNQNATPILALPAPPGSYPGNSGAAPSYNAAPQDPFAASGTVAAPPSVQMAQMAHQQQMLFGTPGNHYSMPQQVQQGPIVPPVLYGGQVNMPAGYSMVATPPVMAANPFQGGYPAAPLTPQGVGNYQQSSNPFGNPNLL